MTHAFGIPVLVSILLGILFPYTAVSLVPYGAIFLFLLMIWAGLLVDWQRVAVFLRRPTELAIGLVLLFVVFPLGQWLLAAWLVTDQQFLYGMVFASLCPVAIVAPFFTRLLEGDEEYAFLLMVSSTAICPIVAPLMLKILLSSVITVNVQPLMKYLFLLVTLPLVVSYAINRLLPALRTYLVRHMAVLNVFTLSFLIFILFGTAVGRLNIQYTPAIEIWTLLLLVFIQDFGVLVLSRLMLRQVYGARLVNAMIISLSMKNVAIAAGVLLFYDPRASFAPALAFVTHALLFSFVSIFRKATWLRAA